MLAFMKERTIYEKKTKRVYIHQCHATGRKTNYYMIREDNEVGMGFQLGTITWRGHWRQEAHDHSGNNPRLYRSCAPNRTRTVHQPPDALAEAVEILIGWT